MPKDQIDSALIHANYFSQKDIEACLKFDIGTLVDQSNYAAIRTLFAEFEAAYKPEDE